MATISLTELVFNSDLETATVNSIFQEVQDFIDGTTASADITITGIMTSPKFQTNADGAAVAGSGTYTMGAGDDASWYWDGSTPVLETSVTNDSAVQSVVFKNTTTAAPLVGFGMGLDFSVETSASNYEVGVQLQAVTTDVSGGSEDFDFVINLMTAGATAAEIARFQSDGKLDLVTGAEYQIAGTDVLSATTLGAGVVNSSLTSVGTLTSLTITGDLTVDTNTLFVDSTNNRVGIGTVSPAHTLHLSSTDATFKIEASDDSIARLVLNAGTTNDGFIKFEDDGVAVWATGMHSVGANDFLISNSNVLGTNNRFKVTTGGNVTLFGNLTVDTDTLFVNATNNRVGIGTASPNNTLHIKSTASNIILEASDDSASRILIKGGATTDAFIEYDAGGTSFWSSGMDTSDSNSYVISNHLSLGTNNRFKITTGGAVTFFGDLTVDTDTFFVDATNNRIGIGTITPASTFHLSSTDATARIAASDDSIGRLFISGGATSDAVLIFQDNGSTVWTSGLDSTDSNSLVIANGSTLGTNNRFTLTTAGAATFFGNVTISASNLTVDTDTFFVDATNNRIGIGTITPASTFHLSSTDATARIAASDDSLGRLFISGGATSDAVLIFQDDGSTVWTSGLDSTDSNSLVIANGSTLGTNNRFRLTTGGDATFFGNLTVDTDTFFIDATANEVGIGTVSPTSKLHIDQSSLTAAIPVLKLDQGDVSEPFIDYIGTATADALSSISTLNTSGATTDHIQIDLNGTKAWIAVSTNDPT